MNGMDKSEALIRMEQLRKKAENGMKMEVWGGIGILILPVGLALLIGGIRKKEKAISDMDDLYKEVFIREPLEANFEEVTFAPMEGLSEETVEGFRICGMGNEFDSESYGTARFRDARIEMSEVVIDEYDRLAEKNNTKIIFKGRMMVIEFPNRITSSETVFSRSFTNRLLSNEEEERGKVSIENAEYGGIFDLYVSDPETASGPVAPQLMDRLKSLAVRHQGVAMKLVENRLILAIDDGAGELFYRKKGKIEFDSELAKVQEDLDDIKTIINRLLENPST